MFYIRQVSPNWYNLNIVGSHFTMSCGDFDSVVGSLTKIVKKYKDRKRLERVLARMEYHTRYKTEVEKCEQYYKESGDEYSGIVRETVVRAMEEVKKDTPLKQFLRKKTKNGFNRTLLREKDGAADGEEQVVVETVAQEEQTTGTHLLRPKVLKYKR